MHEPRVDTHRRGLAVFCAISAVLLAFLFRDALLRGYVLLGWHLGNPLLSDIPTVFYPFIRFARSAVLSGRLPLWNSAIGTGQPFLAAFQAAVLSPFSLLTYILPWPHGFTADVAARLFVGGLGMYLFLRRLAIGIPAALFGGVAYLLNPFSVVWLAHPLSAVAAWLPWLLMAVDRAAERPDRQATAWVAAAVAGTLLGGHPETAFKVCLLAGAYAVYRAAAGGRAMATLGAVALGTLLGVLICAIQLLPFFEYLAHSHALEVRGNSDRVFLVSPARSFVTAFVPDFFGTPVGRRFMLTGTNFNEQQMYPGIVAWAFAAMAPLHPRLRGRAVFFLGAAAIAALMMHDTWFTRLVVTALPPLRVVALSRFGLIAIVGLAFAAAVGVDVLLAAGRDAARHARLARIVTATAVAVGVIVFAFVWGSHDLVSPQRVLRPIMRAGDLLVLAVVLVWLTPVLRRWAGVLAIALLSVDLVWFADGFHPLMPRAQAVPENLPALSIPRNDPEIFRIIGWEDALPPNTSMLYDLQDIRAYDGIGVRDYSDLMDVTFSFTGFLHRFVDRNLLHVLDLLNVKYVISNMDPGLPDSRFERLQDLPLYVYRNRLVEPRAFLVDSYIVLEGRTALRALRDAKADFARRVILGLEPDRSLRPEPAGGDVGRAVIRRYRDESVAIATRAGGRRLLVLVDAYFPGWVAYLDGVRTPILRADYAFRAVSVPAGEHLIEFRYEPASVRYGALLSIAGLLVAAVLVRPARTPRQVSGTNLTAAAPELPEPANDASRIPSSSTSRR